jgi:hypothetical protein
MCLERGGEYARGEIPVTTATLPSNLYLAISESVIWKSVMLGSNLYSVVDEIFKLNVRFSSFKKNGGGAAPQT